jgi:hypothetical protein
MVPKFKMDVKTFLSIKFCVFNYFLKFLQDCLNLDNWSSFTKKKGFIKIQNDKFFAQSFMMVAEPPNERF